MAFEIGILFAIGALFAWGFTDFLIQRSSRAFGSWETLFFVSMSGSIVFLPFVYQDIGSVITSDNVFFLFVMAAVTLLGACMFHCEALKKGKMAVIEPIMTLEVPISAGLAFLVIDEIITPSIALVVISLMTGLFLVSMRTHHFSKKAWLEKGTLLAIWGAALLGASNFLVGIASRTSNPLLAVWFLNLFMLMICFFYFMTNKKINHLIQDFRHDKRLVVMVSLIDNLAWAFFALAVISIPIGLAVVLSENYIVLAAMLGIIINKEKMLYHQKFGLLLALLSAIFLAFVA